MKVFVRNFKETTLAKYFIKVPAHSSFTRLRVIRQINIELVKYQKMRSVRKIMLYHLLLWTSLLKPGKIKMVKNARWYVSHFIEELPPYSLIIPSKKTKIAKTFVFVWNCFIGKIGSKTRISFEFGYANTQMSTQRLSKIRNRIWKWWWDPLSKSHLKKITSLSQLKTVSHPLKKIVLLASIEAL